MPVTGRFNAKRLLKAFGRAFLPLFTIVIVVGGVTGGIMTATESAAFACAYALLLVLVVLRRVNLKRLFAVGSRVIRTLAVTMILIAIANSFGWIVAYLGIPRRVTSFFLSITTNKYVLLFLCNILLLILGCFMSMGSILIIVTPIIRVESCD